MLKILKKTIHCVKSVLIQSFFWPVFSRIRTEYGEILVFGHFSRSNFVELPLVANSEPRVILSFSWNLANLSLDAVVLQFLKICSSVFFKGFQIVSNLSFLQFRISCFLERPLSGCIFDRIYLCCLFLYALLVRSSRKNRGEIRAPCTPSLNPPLGKCQRWGLVSVKSWGNESSVSDFSRVVIL